MLPESDQQKVLTHFLNPFCRITFSNYAPRKIPSVAHETSHLIHPVHLIHPAEHFTHNARMFGLSGAMHTSVTPLVVLSSLAHSHSHSISDYPRKHDARYVVKTFATCGVEKLRTTRRHVVAYDIDDDDADADDQSGGGYVGYMLAHAHASLHASIDYDVRIILCV